MTTIKALAAFEQGQELKDYEYTEEELTSFQTLIEIDHCGICYSDIHMIDNDWKSTKYPIVPGHEIIGHVKKIGPEVTHLKEGDLVGIGWQRSSCLMCKMCLKGYENLCTGRRASTIVRNHGGFADQIVFDSRFAFKIPENLNPKTTAPLLCGGITVYNALKEAGMISGQDIGIIGIGGLGHMAVQFASKLGNKVTIFTTSEDKAEFAHKLGAENAVLTKEKLPGTIKNKLDIILNTVDKPYDWGHYFRYLEPNGTFIMVGNPGNSTFNPGSLFSGKKLTGSSIGPRNKINEMLKVASRYDIGAIIEEFTFQEANTAIQKIKDNKIRYRAVLNMK